MSEFDFSIGDMPTESSNSNNCMAKVDRYKITELLGRGGFGAVFLAQDEVSQQLVALKTLPSELNQSPEELDAIRKNFQIISNLHHPNIAAAKHLHQVEKVETFTSGVHIEKGEYLLVMEYVSGSTLAHWKRQYNNSKVPLDKALEICRQIASGLDFAHSCKVIHRDIKPGNIMLDSAGHVKILDFGLAAEIRSSMSRVSTETSSSSGTRPYMAPEQLAGKTQDERSDQYSLAVLFYELISGGVPFKSVFETGDVLLMMEVVKKNNPDSLAELSGAQNKALLKALAKSKNDRFDNCSNFSACLSGVRKIKQGIPGKILLSIGSLVLVLAISAAFLLIVKDTKTSKVLTQQTKQKSNQAADKPENLQAIAEKQKLEKENERITTLYKQAANHLNSGNLVQARKIWVDIQQLRPDEVQAQELLKKHAGKMTLRDVVPLKSQSELLRTQNLKAIEDLGQYNKECRELNILYLSGKTFYDTQNFDDAFDCLTRFNGRVKALEELIRQKAAYQLSTGKFSTQEKQFLRDFPEITNMPIWNELQSLKKEVKRLTEVNDYNKAQEQISTILQKMRSSETGIIAMRKAKLRLNSLTQQYTAQRKSFTNDISQSDAFAYAPKEMELVEKTIHQLKTASENFDPETFGKQLSVYQKATDTVRRKVIDSQQNQRYRILFSKAQFEYSQLKHDTALNNVQEALRHRNTAEARDLKAKIEKNLKPVLKVNISTPNATLYVNGEKTPYDGNFAQLKLIRSADYKLRITAPQHEDFYYQFQANFNGTKAITAALQKVDLLKKAFSFLNGELEVLPVRTQSPDGGFWMDRYEVTQSLYSRVIGNNPSFKPGRSKPVTNVSWNEATYFCTKLNKLLKERLPQGYAFRLPTENEWQLVCLGGRSGSLGFSHLNTSNTCFKSSSNRRYQAPIESGSLAPNAFGFYDMHGNVWEWVSGGSSSQRIRKGGSYTSTSESCKASKRSIIDGSLKLKNTGFRIVLSKI